MAILRGAGRGSQSIMEACPPENASTAGSMPDKSDIKFAGMADKAPYGKMGKANMSYSGK
tara:strand:- start:80 stop:259 length:180 start_codon:yes stop_codon:yes gene_type:complete